MPEQDVLSEELEREAQAFDAHILERVQHGHIPDLRRTEACDWFQNNVWRRPYLVQLLNGRVVEFCVDHLGTPGGRVLEVGCGPGHMALELARHGFHVTGLDVSAAALELARRMAAENPYRESWGSADYVRADFLHWEPPTGVRFQGVCFFGALHHFPEPARVLDRAASFLAPGGRLMVYEPARDWWTRREAAVMMLIRAILSAAGHWFETIPLPGDAESLDRLVREGLAEAQEAKVHGEPEQSPMDNSSFGTGMLAALRERFTEVGYQVDTLMFDRVAAGIRLPSDDQARTLAEFLQRFELYAIDIGLMRPGGFMFAGQRR